ncbi:MAG: class I SAM-dependent methyltransferase [Kiritimatiellales bacterium]|nr:class I SAM-dependent methyltransferase [Kiritimatiellales bacterium]
MDLGMSPLCESFLSEDQLNDMEPFYPLHVKVCQHCLLVQLDQNISPEHIFTEYAYFSSYSDSWLRHAADYTDRMVDQLGLGAGSFVVELGSNDGYLLRNFVAKGIPCLGVDPAQNIAKEAGKAGIPTLVRFFGEESAKQMVADRQQADLIIGNNVLAQVPDLNDFVKGIKLLLKPDGVATIEFPHLVSLMEQNQYDTIYHEHYCYFSYLSAERIFSGHGLKVFDADELPTHGGSLRIHACHAADVSRPVSERAVRLRAREMEQGYAKMETYSQFGRKVEESKRALLSFLIQAKREGKTIAGYGAPGKGNTLLNYCGIRKDFIDFTVDRNPHKHGKVLPGTHIPIYPVGKIDEMHPDYLMILAWNIKEEVIEQMGRIREWGGKFVVPIPTAHVID